MLHSEQISGNKSDHAYFASCSFVCLNKHFVNKHFVNKHFVKRLSTKYNTNSSLLSFCIPYLCVCNSVSIEAFRQAFLTYTKC